MINKASWDSAFFGLKIGSVTTSNVNLDEYNDFDLIYSRLEVPFFFETKLYFSNFSEVKVLFGKELEQLNFNCSNILNFSDTNLIPENLHELAFESGKFSRFKLDNNFKTAVFFDFYKTWINNSIKKGFADKIFIYMENNIPFGFVSIRITNNTATIGLIAVDEKQQGKGIGRKLILHSENYLFQNNIKTLFIPTQLENKPACGFYEKMGYTITEKTYVTHYWKK